MPRCVAFLRGINLGNRRLSMARLKTVFEELDFADVSTFIASGNVIFSSDEKPDGRLEARIAQHLETSLGYPVDTFVRTMDEAAAIGRARAFPEDGEPGMTIHVGFLHRPFSPTLAQGLTAVRSDVDAFRAEGREFYWLCRIRTSESRIWMSPEMKALKLPTCTMRNMSSIRKLLAKHGG